jgi:predicted permease
LTKVSRNEPNSQLVPAAKAGGRLRSRIAVPHRPPRDGPDSFWFAGAEARRRVALELGGATQVREEVRDIWLTRWLRDFVSDLRFSARSFRRSPSFTATVVLSLALGIGATTALYSLIDQVVLRALPVDHPERLVLIDWIGFQNAETMGTRNLMSYPIFRDLQQHKEFFEGVFCRAATTINLSTSGEPKLTAAELVSGTYFSVLGVSPALGRLFTIDDDQAPGSSPVVVLSYDFWKNQFGSAQGYRGPKGAGEPVPDDGCRGRCAGISWHRRGRGSIALDSSGHVGPGHSRLQTMLDRRTRWVQILGRLKQNVSLAQAQTGLQPWFKAMLDEDTRRTNISRASAENRRRFLASTLALTPAPQGHSVLRHELFAATLGLVRGDGGAPWLWPCLNVAGLFLARGSARHPGSQHKDWHWERRAGGIGRQLLADSVLLAFTGGLLGVEWRPLPYGAHRIPAPTTPLRPASKPTSIRALLLFAFLASLANRFPRRLCAALQAGRKSLESSLRSGAAQPSGGLSLRRWIVTAQIAFTLILVVAAGLFIQTLHGLLQKVRGFETSSLISFGIRPALNGYSGAEATQLIRRISEGLRNSGSTQASSIASVQLLLGGAWNNSLTIQSGERFTTDREVQINAVTPGFFDTLGTRIIAGRDFNEHDSARCRPGESIAARE